MTKRAEQVASSLQRALQKALSEGLNDPRLQAMITITGTRVDDALSEAVVSVSVLPESKEDLVLHGLKSAAGRIRRVASDALDMKRTPRLIFRLDRTLKRQAGILNALADVARERDSTDESTNRDIPPIQDPKGQETP